MSAALSPAVVALYYAVSLAGAVGHANLGVIGDSFPWRRRSPARRPVLGYALLNKTRIGEHLVAVGGNEEAARLTGRRCARVGAWCRKGRARVRMLRPA